MRRAGIVFAILFAFVGCGGGASTTPAPAVTATTAAASPTWTPGAMTASVDLVLKATLPATPASVGRAPRFVASTTASVALSATSSSGSTSGTFPVTFGASPPNACGTTLPYTCRISFGAPLGSTTFIATLRDASNNVLGRGSQTATVTATGPNSVTLTVNPYIKNPNVTAWDTSFSGVTNTVSLVVSPLDASGTPITGTDTFLNAIQVTVGAPTSVSVVTNPANCSTSFPYNNGTPLTISSASIIGYYACTTASATSSQTVTFTPLSTFGPTTQQNIFITPQTQYYVALLGSSQSVNIYNAATGTRLYQNVYCPMTCLVNFVQFAWDTTDNLLFLTENNGGAVAVYDVSNPAAPAALTSLSNVATGGAWPFGIVWDSARSKVYITRSDGQVLQANAAAGAAATSLFTLSGVTQVTLDPTNTCLIVGSSSTVQTYNLNTTATSTQSGVDGSTQLSAGNAGTYLIAGGVTTQTLVPLAANCTLGTPVNVTPGSNSNGGVAIDKAGTTVYITNTNNKTLTRYRITGGGTSLLTLNAVNFTNAPNRIFWDQQQRRLYVRDLGGNVQWYGADLQVKGPLMVPGNGSTYGFGAGG